MSYRTSALKFEQQSESQPAPVRHISQPAPLRHIQESALFATRSVVIDTTNATQAIPFDSGVLPYVYPGGGCLGAVISPAAEQNYSSPFVVTGIIIAFDSDPSNAALIVQVFHSCIRF